MSTSVKPQLYTWVQSPLQWPGRVGSVGPNPGQWVWPALERLHWHPCEFILTISAPPPYPRPNPGQPPTGRKIQNCAPPPPRAGLGGVKTLQCERRWGGVLL
jgi:hypothetical protein